MLSKTMFQIYKLFLLAYPRAFRVESGPEMVETLRARYAAVRARSDSIRRARFWIRELRALLRTGIRLRLSHVKPPRFSFAQASSRTWYDLLHAIRSVRRNPMFTTAAALTVALGIGSATVIFSFVHAILLSPLPYQNPDRIVRINTMWFGQRGTSLSEPEYYGFRTQARSLASVVATYSTSRTLLHDTPRRITTLQATHEMFSVLGVAPQIGRAFTIEEEHPDAPAVALLSHGFWLEMFGGEPDVVGTSIDLGGRPHEIIGVMPPEFRFPTPEVAIWTPYTLDPTNMDYWNNHYLRAIARLADGVDLETARAEIRAMGERYVAEHQEFLSGFGFGTDLLPLFDDVVGEARTPLLLLLGAVGFLLLIGCSNVANLLLARGETRKQEIAVRTALGASRRRVLGQLLLESLALAVTGGVLGLLLAPLGIATLKAAALDTIPRIDDVAIDPQVMAFVAIVTILTGLLFGILPALTTSRFDLQTHLKEGGRSHTGSRRGNLSRRTLVAVEVALSVILVIGAGIMLKSLGNIRSVDTGFRTEDVLTMRLSLPTDAFESQQSVAFYEDLLEEVEALPGAATAGAVSRLPLFQGMGTASIQIEGREVTTIGEAPTAEVLQVTPGYFPTMDLMLRGGRFLTRTDHAGNLPVVVVNQSFVDRHWPQESAVGRRIKLYASRLPWLEIVGVVGNERHNDILGEPRPKMYMPHAQAPEAAYGTATTMNLVVHGEAVERLAGPIRAIVRDMNGAIPVYHVQTMEDVKSAAMVDRSYPTVLLTLFGLLALFLASVGIYGLVAFHVNQARHDIGVHLALGATAQNVRWRVLGLGMAPVLAGVAAGLAGAFGLTRMIGGLLYEVSPIDPAVYVGVPALLLLVAMTASLIPATRATRLDPVEVLRAE
jgi:predicted permease